MFDEEDPKDNIVQKGLSGQAVTVIQRLWNETHRLLGIIEQNNIPITSTDANLETDTMNTMQELRKKGLGSKASTNIVREPEIVYVYGSRRKNIRKQEQKGIDLVFWSIIAFLLILGSIIAIIFAMSSDSSLLIVLPIAGFISLICSIILFFLIERYCGKKRVEYTQGWDIALGISFFLLYAGLYCIFTFFMDTDNFWLMIVHFYIILFVYGLSALYYIFRVNKFKVPWKSMYRRGGVFCWFFPCFSGYLTFCLAFYLWLDPLNVSLISNSNPTFYGTCTGLLLIILMYSSISGHGILLFFTVVITSTAPFIWHLLIVDFKDPSNLTITHSPAIIFVILFASLSFLIYISNVEKKWCSYSLLYLFLIAIMFQILADIFGWSFDFFSLWIWESNLSTMLSLIFPLFVPALLSQYSCFLPPFLALSMAFVSTPYCYITWALDIIALFLYVWRYVPSELTDREVVEMEKIGAFDYEDDEVEQKDKINEDKNVGESMGQSTGTVTPEMKRKLKRKLHSFQFEIYDYVLVFTFISIWIAYFLFTHTHMKDNIIMMVCLLMVLILLVLSILLELRRTRNTCFDNFILTKKWPQCILELKWDPALEMEKPFLWIPSSGYAFFAAILVTAVSGFLYHGNYESSMTQITNTNVITRPPFNIAIVVIDLGLVLLYCHLYSSWEVVHRAADNPLWNQNNDGKIWSNFGIFDIFFDSRRGILYRSSANFGKITPLLLLVIFDIHLILLLFTGGIINLIQISNVGYVDIEWCVVVFFVYLLSLRWKGWSGLPFDKLSPDFLTLPNFRFIHKWSPLRYEVTVLRSLRIPFIGTLKLFGFSTVLTYCLNYKDYDKELYWIIPASFMLLCTGIEALIYYLGWHVVHHADLEDKTPNPNYYSNLAEIMCLIIGFICLLSFPFIYGILPLVFFVFIIIRALLNAYLNKKPPHLGSALTQLLFLEALLITVCSEILCYITSNDEDSCHQTPVLLVPGILLIIWPIALLVSFFIDKRSLEPRFVWIILVILSFIGGLWLIIKQTIL